MKNLPFFTCASRAPLPARACWSREGACQSSGRPRRDLGSQLESGVAIDEQCGRDEVEHRRPALPNGLWASTDRPGEAGEPPARPRSTRRWSPPWSARTVPGSTARNSPRRDALPQTLPARAARSAGCTGPQCGTDAASPRVPRSSSRPGTAGRSKATRRPSRNGPARRAGRVRRRWRLNRGPGRCAPASR